MKTRTSSFAVTLLPSLAAAAAMHSALMLVSFRDSPIADHKGMLLWWAGLVVCHTVLRLFLQKPRELRSIILVCTAMLAAQLTACILWNPVYPSLVSWGILAAMWAAGYYQCADALLNGVKPESLMSIFELCAMALLFFAAILNSGAIAPQLVVHLAVGLLCILLSLMRLRTLHTRIDSHGEHSPVELLVPVILLVTAGCCILFCLVISGSAYELLSRFTAALLSVLSAFGQGVERFLYWLLSLLPAAETDLGSGGYAAPALPSETIEDMPQSSGIVLYLLIAAFVVAALVFVVKIWRKVHLQAPLRRKVSAGETVVKKSGIGAILRRFLNRLLGRVRFELSYVRSRNTPAGLLVWLERRMGRKRMGRKRGETASAFLTRAGTALPHCAVELQLLSDTLNRQYFGSGGSLSPQTIRELRRKLKQNLSK